MTKIILISIIIVLLSAFLLSIRLLFVKNGEFRGSCANNNPMLQKEGAVCGVCGRKTGEPCGESGLTTNN